MAKKRPAVYKPAWGAITSGFTGSLPEMRRILTKIGVEWDEINFRGTKNDDDGVLVFFTEDEVKKLPIDDTNLNKDTGRKPTGLYRHYLPTFEYKPGEYGGHSIYEVTLFQLTGLIKGGRRMPR